MNAVDQSREAEIRAEERAATAEEIATILARKVCGLMCEHPSCSTYRFAARIARQHGQQPHIPTQQGARP